MKNKLDEHCCKSPTKTHNLKIIGACLINWDTGLVVFASQCTWCEQKAQHKPQMFGSLVNVILNPTDNCIQYKHWRKIS